MHQDVLVEVAEFIGQSDLNKMTTVSLLSLLNSAKNLDLDDFPRTIDSLWRKLQISFIYETLFFCTNCFQPLKRFRDTCGVCNNKTIKL